ncbi:MAG: STAS domain-containing protein [Clostridia bacterium]|nr:STAS domain-containing protein [Clostridia bacterium]
MKEVQIKGMENGKLTVALSGEIDSGKAEEFFAAVSSAYRETPASLSFECAELNFIDSTTLGTFVKILKLVKTDGNGMSLQGLQPKIKKLFLICSLDTIMEIE